MSTLDHRVTITYSGPYTQDATGEEKVANNLKLEYVDEQREDRDAGILGDCVIALPPETDATDEAETHWEQLAVSIDYQLWCEAVCEQTGGHNYTPHQWTKEPESACQICTRCGSEIDPA